MSMASFKAAIRSVFNSPEEEVERHIRADAENDEMSISKGVIENICLNALAEGVEFVRLKEVLPDLAKLYYVLTDREVECGELPVEMATHLAKRIRVLANIDGWGHSDTKPFQMDVSCHGHNFHLTISEFQLKPKVNVLIEVKHVDGP